MKQSKLRKIFATLLAVVMILCVMPLGTLAQNDGGQCDQRLHLQLHGPVQRPEGGGGKAAGGGGEGGGVPHAHDRH